jgi:Flp pilus assembly protein TadD
MKFANFEFDPREDRLGSGPQSEVYRALDTRLGRSVALKILRPNVEFDPDAVTRFQREAKHTSSLAHQNIATIYEYDKHEGTSYIAMELLEGQTLDRILQQRLLGFDEVLRVGLQVASALELVHQQHLIHRDLKPANIMVQADGTVKLLDFGICRQANESNITQEGMLVGTVLYMSPEQVRGQDLDVRSDVFAFGAVLYHALTGELPFPGKTFPEVCMAILDGTPRPPAEVRSGAPQPLERVVLRCLSPEPADRYAHGGALHAALQAAAQEIRAGQSGKTATALRGRIVVPPLSVLRGGDNGRLFGGATRRDLRAELERSTGLEIVLVDAEGPAEHPPGTFLLRGTLELGETRAVAEIAARRQEASGGLSGELWNERIEVADTDEWGLQGQLVRALARTVRRRLAEQAAEPQAAVRRDARLAAAHARHAHDVLHRGTTKHLLASVSGFRRAIEADPECAIAHAGLAEALVRKYVYWDGDQTFLDEAFQSARRALILSTTCAEAHTSLGFAYAMMGQAEDAQREYSLAIQIDHDEWLAHRLKGALLARQGNYKAAAALLRRAVALKPEHIGSYDHLYSVLTRMGRYQEALEIGEEAIAAARQHLEEAEDSQEARLHLALIQARIGRSREALEAAQEARQKAPKDGYTMFHVACVLALIGRNEEAMRALEEAQARGYFLRTELFSNSDLDGLRELPAFQELAG